VKFRQLHPTAAEVDVAELLNGLQLPGKARPDRPYTLANFIASADGRAAFHGRSGALGDDGDRAMFHGLREQVDAVVVGTGTLAIERYGRLVRDPVRRQRRIAAGLAAEPVAVVITRSGTVPLSIPLFEEPEARVWVYTGDHLAPVQTAAQVEVRECLPNDLTNKSVLEDLRRRGVRTLLCEGGPTLFGALVRDGLLDELFLTLAPKLTGGGTGPAMTQGPELPEPALLSLKWALERAGSLYLRYELG
jgi:riboflavin-specific deaminase-like protein